MINIIDDFLDKELYDSIMSVLSLDSFNEVVVGEKSFWIHSSDESIDSIIINKINALEGIERRNILSFFRVATDKVDTDWRIHSDAIINGERPDRALVLYLSPSTMDGLHGTAFWEHKSIGHCLPKNVSFDMFDEMLIQESNDRSRWDLQSVVGYKVNRAVCYPCNYFHSKYPNEGWADGRMVYVMFYK